MPEQTKTSAVEWLIPLLGGALAAYSPRYLGTGVHTFADLYGGLQRQKLLRHEAAMQDAERESAAQAGQQAYQVAKSWRDPAHPIDRTVAGALGWRTEPSEWEDVVRRMAEVDPKQAISLASERVSGLEKAHAEEKKDRAAAVRQAEADKRLAEKHRAEMARHDREVVEAGWKAGRDIAKADTDIANSKVQLQINEARLRALKDAEAARAKVMEKPPATPAELIRAYNTATSQIRMLKAEIESIGEDESLNTVLSSWEQIAGQMREAMRGAGMKVDTVMEEDALSGLSDAAKDLMRRTMAR